METTNVKHWPSRVASWWSRLEDLQWPEQRARDMIQRRADQLAEARIDTVMHFGFHFRFDFIPYFGLLHGLLRDITESLHARGMRFLDHYSCNLVARPRGKDDLFKYHAANRHHIALHIDPDVARTMSYAGVPLANLHQVDIETGQPGYAPQYQAELWCHNNPDFLRMHEAYLRRHIDEVGCDGFQTDDMCDYAYFRNCACAHCRERFRKEFGHELPPFSDTSFWGDTSRHPTEWGNYDHPAFRDWVTLRYRGPADHLAMVKRVIGPSRVLMSCCSINGPMLLNSMGLSYESFIPHCDWLLLENCGLTTRAVDWARTEPEAMLARAIGQSKDFSGIGGAPLALSYSVYQDGAYLAFAIARFWGVCNWFSTLSTGLPITPDDAKDDAELIGPYNRWEIEQSNLDLMNGRDVVEARLLFARTSRDNGWRDPVGRDHWERTRRWSGSLLRHDVGYAFLTTAALDDVNLLCSDASPIIVDGASHLSEAHLQALINFARRGGRLYVVPPIGIFDEKGNSRSQTGIDELLNHCVVLRDISDDPAEQLIETKQIAPALRRTAGTSHWRLRLRRHGEQLVLHLLNDALVGIEHPKVRDRWLRDQVLDRIESTAAGPAYIELDLAPVPEWQGKALYLRSPELASPLETTTEGTRLRIPLERLRIYGVIST